MQQLNPASGILAGPVAAVDYHTAGEPFRIVQGVELPGATVWERRAALKRAIAEDGQLPAAELIRQLLCREPRGHADMYGGFIVPADDEGAAFGVLFWHNDGYSTACGHGTIALGTWAVDSGLVDVPADGETEIRIDVPSGRVTALVTTRQGRVERVTFQNVEAYPLGRDVPAGQFTVDLAYSGAVYAVLDAAQLGLAVEPADLPALIRAGREIKAALRDEPLATHAGDGLYGVIFYDSRRPDPAGLYQRNVTIFADGQVDRSPCGSGTSACLALLDLPAGQVLRHASIVGTEFLASASGITGSAYRTGTSVFELDPADALGTGFVLR
ncbi:proline racemase family protein [Longispora albida]|uniref:proline racemase family protein n=1 Tax=Longispora albida TaxID=203523 RepID=UPI0003803222|nr:proline racemase family protein [Longispora albida]